MDKAWRPRATLNTEMALEEWLEKYWPDVWDEQQELVLDELESGINDFDTYVWLGENYPDLPLLFDTMWAMAQQQQKSELALAAHGAVAAALEHERDVYKAAWEAEHGRAFGVLRLLATKLRADAGEGETACCRRQRRTAAAYEAVADLLEAQAAIK